MTNVLGAPNLQIGQLFVIENVGLPGGAVIVEVQAETGGGGTGTATAVAGAATLNQPAGTITSEALVTASTYTLTLLNSLIKSTSVVIVNAVTSTSASSAALLSAKAITAGQLVVTFLLGPALTGTVAIDFAVFN